MKCRVCETEDVPDTWRAVAWCDPCLTRGLELRDEQPGLTIHEVRDVVREERKGSDAVPGDGASG